MRNKISVLLLSLMTVFMFTGCEDEQEPFGAPYKLMVVGLSKVVPETTHEYTLGPISNPESYTWTVEGPAEIVGSNKGATVTVSFKSVGDVILSVTNGSDKGSSKVSVAKTEASVAAVLDTTASGQPKALSSGQSDTVFFSFAAPVEGMPSLALLTPTDTTAFNKGTPFLSGTIGELQKLNDKNFYAIYTAGEGNGTPEAMLRNIVSKAPYGSVKLDSATVELFRVDNIAPVASLTYSSEFIKGGTPITITATFSEAVMPGANGKDLFATLNGAGISKRLPLKPTAGNPLVYTLVDTLKTTETGQITVGLENIVDFAENELNGVSNAKYFFVDNAAPVLALGTATDAGNYAFINVESTNSGTVKYVVAKAGTATPKTAAEFAALSGIVSGSVDVVRNQAKSVAQALAKGEYVVFFMATDKAGNNSVITSAALSMN